MIGVVMPPVQGALFVQSAGSAHRPVRPSHVAPVIHAGVEDGGPAASAPPSEEALFAGDDDVPPSAEALGDPTPGAVGSVNPSGDVPLHPKMIAPVAMPPATSRQFIPRCEATGMPSASRGIIQQSGTFALGLGDRTDPPRCGLKIDSIPRLTGARMCALATA
jgi:hypothetical protein